MPTCSFCKKNYENPRGLTIFTVDGRSIFFCSSKCRRNAKLKRDPKKVNWVKREKKEVKKRKIRVVEKKVEDKKTEIGKLDKKTEFSGNEKSDSNNLGDNKRKKINNEKILKNVEEKGIISSASKDAEEISEEEDEEE